MAFILQRFLAPVLISAAVWGCAAIEPSAVARRTLGPQYASTVNWRTLEKGLKIARSKKKPMLVDFAVSEDCERCEFLQNNVYNRTEITDKINSDFVAVWIDLDREPTPEEKYLGEKFDYEEECLLLFLDHLGNIIEDPEGKRMCFVDEIPPEIFIEYLDYVRAKYIPAQ